MGFSDYRLSLELNQRALQAAAAGNLTTAAELLTHAVALSADNPAIHANLGVLLNMIGRPQEAIASLLRSIQLKEDVPAVYNNLSNAFCAAGQPDAAENAANRSLHLDPNQAEALNALGNALKDQGRLAAAMAAFERGAALRPDLPQLAGNRLYTAHFLDGMSPQRLLEMHRQWGESFASLSKQTAIAKRQLSRRERLRIGYVSPDFREHPVGRFMMPLLISHDRKRYSIHCYSNVGRADFFTEHIRTQTERWHEVADLSDEQLADKIQRDRIDILVDLSLHMRGNRLQTFARRAAPVQVTYLGYCSTSGLEAMDFRLSDVHLDPIGSERDSLYTERTLRLPRCYWCYAPPKSPPVSPLPMRRNRFATFGCLNNFCKVTEATLLIWRSLLRELSTARLVLHVADGSARERVLRELDIPADRVRFVGRVPHEQYLRLYHHIDIALDPVPCGGGTTTCDALWMGVPVVSLAGQTAVSRSGLSILSNAGLPQFVAKTRAEYHSIAFNAASSGEQLSELRRTMRQRLIASPLMNVSLFIRDIEAAFQRMWAGD